MHILTFLKSSGQATIEYLFVLIFIVGISLKIVGVFSSFMRDSVGNLGHELSVNLSSGVCESICFFKGYKNGNSGE
jgi:hypothetical protein